MGNNSLEIVIDEKDLIILNCFSDGEVVLQTCFSSHATVTGRYWKNLTKEQVIDIINFLQTSIKNG